MSIVANALLPVFLIIALGVILKRTLLPADESWDSIERLTYFVLFPALLIVTTGTADLHGIPGRDMAIALLASSFCIAAFLLLTRPFIVRRLELSGPSFTSVFQGSTRWNSYITLAIANALFGAHGLALASVPLIALVPVFNVLNVWALARYSSDEKMDTRTTLGHILRNPLIWSCLIGIAINFAGIPLPKFTVAFADILGHASLAIGLLLVGAGLAVGEAFKPSAAVFIAVFLKLVIWPIIGIAIGRYLGLTGAPLAIVAIVSSVPSAPASYVLARQMGGDAPLVARILTIQTILAFFTVSAALNFIGVET